MKTGHKLSQSFSFKLVLFYEFSHLIHHLLLFYSFIFCYLCLLFYRLIVSVNVFTKFSLFFLFESFKSSFFIRFIYKQLKLFVRTCYFSLFTTLVVVFQRNLTSKAVSLKLFYLFQESSLTRKGFNFFLIMSDPQNEFIKL